VSLQVTWQATEARRTLRVVAGRKTG